ncbi:hypothetical protein GGX14DRAFT_573811 [Mycena pura]|uniref:DUF6534 domain-containing protein n=1 Tax=Mycena pura TaxID=153505 RepID=A0AAD6V2H9_9AGAR|nr:hypothetical protein GGX14DRAFT_573811 [Mycena pura]
MAVMGVFTGVCMTISESRFLPGNTYLTGVIMSQFITYWTSKCHDPRWTKSLVAVLFLINAAQAGAVVYMAWFYCVMNFNNPDVVAIVPWPYAVNGFTTAILALVNQTFQSWRIYVFTENKVLVGILFIAASTAFSMGAAASVQSLLLRNLELRKLVPLQPVVEGNLSLQCALDAIIAVILSVNFMKSKTSFATTDAVLNRLIRTVVQTGAFTVFALGAMFSLHFYPSTSLFGLFGLPIGRIYTHTMMDHLNTREQLRDLLLSGGLPVSVSNDWTTPAGADAA